MIEVILADKVLGLAFIHAKRLEPVIARRPPKGKMSNIVDTRTIRYTKCLIFEIDPSQPRGKAQQRKLVTMGVARCSPLDKYVRESGRKVALHKAIWKESKGADGILLATTIFSRFERQKIWDAYLNRGLPKLKEVRLLPEVTKSEPSTERPSQEVADEVV